MHTHVDTQIDVGKSDKKKVIEKNENVQNRNYGNKFLQIDRSKLFYILCFVFISKSNKKGTEFFLLFFSLSTKSKLEKN